jgi:hypothetical protein
MHPQRYPSSVLSSLDILKIISILIALLLSGLLSAQPASEHSCRILFLQGPDQAPDTLHLFDGVSSVEVELPRMNFSKVYRLRPGPLNLQLLPSAVDDPEKVPTGAPSAKVAADVTDFYLLVTSDPSNKVAPVSMQIINAGSKQLKRGQMLWFNLTQNTVGGTVGSETVVFKPGSRTTVDPPATGNTEYLVNLNFRIPGNEHLYPLCETKWLHDPRSRSLAFIIANPGVRTPRVLAFPDYREPEKEDGNE